MQIILDLTEDLAQMLEDILEQDDDGPVYTAWRAPTTIFLLGLVRDAIADAKSREVSAAPRIAKKYIMNCEPGVIFGKLAPIGEKPEK